MAYPFGPPIPLATLIQRLTTNAEFQCTIQATPGTRRSPEGELVQFRYLLRVAGDGPDKIFVAPLPDAEPTEEQMPSVVRSICAQLRLNPNVFGILEQDGPDHDDD